MNLKVKRAPPLAVVVVVGAQGPKPKELASAVLRAGYLRTKNWSQPMKTAAMKMTC